jgi:hypothetical protein
VIEEGQHGRLVASNDGISTGVIVADSLRRTTQGAETGLTLGADGIYLELAKGEAALVRPRFA